MDKLQKNIIAYLTKNFGNKTFVYDTSIPDNETSEIWGFNAIKILTIDEGRIVRYRIMASK